MKRRSLLLSSLLAPLTALVGCVSRSIKLPAGKRGHDPSLFGPHNGTDYTDHPPGWHGAADSFGNPLRTGDYVNVIQLETDSHGGRVAKVVDRFEGELTRTVLEPGHVIDIDFGRGPEGMMTYLMERLEQGDERITNHVWRQGMAQMDAQPDHLEPLMKRYVTSTDAEGKPDSFISFKPYALLLALCLVLPNCTTAAALTAGTLAAKVASPVLRDHDDHKLVGLRVGDYGAGIWFGKVHPATTATERERMLELEEWMLMRQIQLKAESTK